MEDLFRWVAHWVEENGLERVGHMVFHRALEHFVRHSLPHLWGWVRDHWPDVLETVMNWFGLGS